MTGEPGDAITANERQMLELEASWWKYPGAKEDEIRRRFDMSAIRYYQLLNVLIDSPAALAADPVTVNRLRRLREVRAQLRRRAG